MQLVSQEKLDDGRLTMTVRAEPAEVSRAVDGVYRNLSRRANIPGFRKGKVPRALLEQQLSPDEARKLALDNLAEDAVLHGLKEAAVQPLTLPKLEKANAEQDGSAVFVATMTPRPEVELGEYRGLTAVRPAIEVTDEQVDAQILLTRERYGRYEPVTDRAAETGDLALVDYDLVIDGQAVESQSTHGYPCQIGSDTLFPELNEKLVGLKPGEEVRIPASFPADHREPALAGKQGEYVVTLRELKKRVVPELTDEMAQEAHGIPSADDMGRIARALLERMAADEAEDRVQRDLVEQVMGASKVTVPPTLVRDEAEARLDRLETDLRAQSVSLDDYLAERQVDRERWLRNEEMNARRDLERMLVLDEIGRREGIAATQEETTAEIESIARRAGTRSELLLKRLDERDVDRVTDRIERRKVLQFLVDHAEITNEGETAPEHGTAAAAAASGVTNSDDARPETEQVPAASQEDQP
jgi:trigger factor